MLILFTLSEAKLPLFVILSEAKRSRKISSTARKDLSTPFASLTALKMTGEKSGTMGPGAIVPLSLVSTMRIARCA